MRMYPISSHHIIPIQNAQQVFHDCYLVASLGALSRNIKGRKILENNISHNDKFFSIKFENVYGRQESYTVTKQAINNMMLCKSPKGEKNKLGETTPQIIKAVELAMNRLLQKHPFKKPFIYRLMAHQQDFEYNKPSRFLNMFTGKKPLTLNEGGIIMSLFEKQKKAMKLLNEIEKDDGAIFVAGTGINFWGGLPSWHCYTVKNVSIKKNKITLFDHKENREIKLSIQNALHQLKFFTGYFSKDLI